MIKNKLEVSPVLDPNRYKKRSDNELTKSYNQNLFKKTTSYLDRENISAYSNDRNLTSSLQKCNLNKNVIINI